MITQNKCFSSVDVFPFSRNKINKIEIPKQLFISVFQNKQTVSQLTKGWFSSLKPDEANIKSSESNEEWMVEKPPLLLQEMRAKIFRESFLNLGQNLRHTRSVS